MKSLPVLVLLILFACASTLWAQEKKPTAPPNIVFILVDDMGWTDLGCFGSSFYETPNIDRFAASGMRFTNAYAACQVCSPTRASIMTGKYPARLHTTNYFGGRRKGALLPATYIDRLVNEEVTLAEALGEAGYRTGFFGKWHLGGANHLPQHQGFDVNVGGHAGGHPASYFHPFKGRRNPRFDVPGFEGGKTGDYLTDRLTDRALKFVEESRDRPFLLYLAFYSVHTPLQGRPDLVEHFREKSEMLAPPQRARFIPEGRRAARQRQDHAIYAAMVKSVDENVGRILKKLDDLGISERTTVVFTSDNGGLSTSEGSPTSNLPLRAGKGWMYEGGIRVPAIVRWPGTTRAGTVCSTPIITTDFYPTILEIAKLPSRPAQHVDGLSLTPLLKGGSKLERDALFWHYPHYGNQGGRPSGAVRSGNHKLIERFEDGRVELYDLAADPGEAVDLTESQPKQAVMLKRKLHAWRKEVGARMPSPNPSYRPLPPRVLLIGDSISRGYHKPLREILKGRVNVQFIPMNGGATSRGLKRLDEWVGRGEWDLIHFNWGLHDLCWRNPKLKGSGRRDKVNGLLTSTVEQYAKNLAELVTRLEKTGAQLIWATTTPVPKNEPGRFAREELKYNAAAARLMKVRGIAINDLHATITPHIAELQKKGGDVHFTRKGSRFLAERVAAVIVKKLGVKKR